MFEFDVAVLLVWLEGLFPLFVILLTLAVLDLTAGTFSAIKSGTFDLKKFPQFLMTFVKWVLTWFILETLMLLFSALGQFLPEGLLLTVNEMLSAYSGVVVFGGAVIAYVASILGHLQDNTGPGRLSNGLGKVGVKPKAEG